jgi:muramoyltetrapeptide carboxypeptidase
MFAGDFGALEPVDFTLDNFWQCLAGPTHVIDEPAAGNPTVEANGTIWGGNLAMLVSLLGTDYFPRIDGGILFLEDTGEHPYRIERMLYQLHFAGVLARQRAILLGTFNGYTLTDNADGYDAAAMVAHARARFGVRIYTGLPFGHVPEKLTFPVGGRCAIAVRDGLARLAFSDYAR